MKPLHTALLIIGAMLVGAGITYWAVRQLPPVSPAAPKTAAPGNSRTWTLSPRPEVESTMNRVEPSALDEAALGAAVAKAKEERARGELKPIATTPEEFARELGQFNYRLVQLKSEFPERPAAGTPDAKRYDERIDELMRHYANLTLDEALLATVKEETAEELAHFQAHLAGGSLGLDTAGVAKLEVILRGVYAKLFPLDETQPDAEAKLDAATEEIRAALVEILTPEQRERLELMGTDQVLFGLPQPEP